MYFLLKMGIFQPAMLVYQMGRIFFYVSSSHSNGWVKRLELLTWVDGNCSMAKVIFWIGGFLLLLQQSWFSGKLVVYIYVYIYIFER